KLAVLGPGFVAVSENWFSGGSKLVVPVVEKNTSYGSVGVLRSLIGKGVRVTFMESEGLTVKDCTLVKVRTPVNDWGVVESTWKPTLLPEAVFVKVAFEVATPVASIVQVVVEKSSSRANAGRGSSNIAASAPPRTLRHWPIPFTALVFSVIARYLSSG